MSQEESRRRRALRERIENENPELAAAAAVRRFEREAIQVPDALAASDRALPWQARQSKDAAVLYRELAVGDPDGLTLTQLRAASMGLGQKRFDEALRFLRRSGVTTESHRNVGVGPDRIVLQVAR